MNKKFLLYGLAGLFLLVSPALVHAAVVSGGNSVSIASPSIIETNVYIAGGDVAVSVPVNGDVYAAGGTVTIANDVRDDVVVAGGTVTILGNVRGDVRVLGGTAIISKPIGGDLVVVGGTARVAREVTVGGDVLAAAGSLTFDGIARKKITATGGDITINGQAAELVLKAGAIKLGESARIYGPVTYESSQEATIAPGAQISGKVTYTKGNFPTKEEGKNQLAAFLGFISFAKTVLFVVAGLVLIMFFKRGTTEVAIRAIENFGGSFLRGLGVFFVTPLIVILLCMTFVGVLPGVFLAFVYGAALVLSLPVAGIIVGGLIEKFALKKDVVLAWQWSILGILLLVMVGSVPVIGFAIKVIFYATALGSLAQGVQGFLAHKR
jgi:hypothetical protein